MANNTSSATTAIVKVSREASGTCCATLRMSRKKPSLVMWMPSNLVRNPIEHDNHSDACLEASEHRARNEVCDKAEPKDRCADQQRARQRSERRSRNYQLTGVAIRDHQSQFLACENCKRRRRTDAEDARCAQKCVHNHWDESGVEADADRKSRDGRIGHRLGQDDGRRRQAGNDIEAQCW